ncbi:uncharacterized protein LACBIDRAFT_313305 [Laccaria bicolor S238N-H82]|uniref:Predicted protein n=1 Tax=Laccaria bicolor (strain S238N-H82 / ATCC MYA-4686) TaxID=486041 RepID=B0DY15_LACBS|nr:uncharacterized protein LACBIDRAFT_313305 [Laccaria bicolor S238N-H82]EDR00607.1 predicted protein [Laccaria bicolor S238N-H82]|eukprot:XP_001888834.1 predicted protein [Laccaria bicolor S238N-H82]
MLQKGLHEDMNSVPWPISNTFNCHLPQSQARTNHINFIIHPSSSPITLNINLCLTCASIHHNPPDVGTLSLRQPPSEGAVASVRKFSSVWFFAPKTRNRGPQPV